MALGGCTKVVRDRAGAGRLVVVPVLSLSCVTLNSSDALPGPSFPRL